jgi:hypothetical protein
MLFHIIISHIAREKNDVEEDAKTVLAELQSLKDAQSRRRHRPIPKFLAVDDAFSGEYLDRISLVQILLGAASTKHPKMAEHDWHIQCAVRQHGQFVMMGKSRLHKQLSHTRSPFIVLPTWPTGTIIPQAVPAACPYMDQQSFRFE